MRRLAEFIIARLPLIVLSSWCKAAQSETAEVDTKTTYPSSPPLVPRRLQHLGRFYRFKHPLLIFTLYKNFNRTRKEFDSARETSCFTTITRGKDVTSRGERNVRVCQTKRRTSESTAGTAACAVFGTAGFANHPGRGDRRNILQRLCESSARPRSGPGAP